MAKALNTTKGSSMFFDVARAAREFGLTTGGRDSAEIGLTDLGRRLVQPTSPSEEVAAKREAFFAIELFRAVVEYYGGSALPESEYLRNTLESTFGLDPRVHDEFVDIFRSSARFAGVGTTDSPTAAGSVTGESKQLHEGPPHQLSEGAGDLVCFVAMPFGERTDRYATGFFTEV